MPSPGLDRALLDHALLDRFWLDHLWQSTLFALAVGLLVLAFRRGPAGVRYGLWLAASIKFLVPFAALAALGQLAFGALPRIAAPMAHAPAADFLERAARPLAQFPAQVLPALPASSIPLSQVPQVLPPAGPAAQVAASAAHAAPHLDWALILWAIWAVGLAVVLARWVTRMAKVRAAVRGASPLAWAAPMPVLASPSLMEPGLVGLWRPVLLVPETLVASLGQAQIDALIAHEAGHLRRRDNLTAAIHMLVEALVWFHPLVWWIGARLIEERERACDDAVVRAGHDRAAYARSIVDICRLCLQSPLPCVSGVTGSNLMTRVERIMTAPVASPLSRSGKVVLAAAASFAFATPVAAGLLTPQAQESVAPLAKAVAAIAAPAHAFGAAKGSDQAPAETPVVLARNDVVLGPSLAVAATDAAPVALAQTLAAPRLDPEPSQAAPPIQLAAAAPPAPAPVPQPAERIDPGKAAASFVKTYAATGRRQVIARWAEPICVSVTGLPPHQAETVKARVEQVAKGVGANIQFAGCQRANIEIGFAADAQAMLDDVIKTDSVLLGDQSKGPKSRITLPIQAWYATGGLGIAANGAGDLKALADYRATGPAGLKTLVVYQANGQFGGAPVTTAGQSTPSSNDIPGLGGYGGSAGGGDLYQNDYWASHNFPFGAGRDRDRSSANQDRQFANVLIIVDTKRIPHARLGPVGDYVAMLALSQSRSLGQCQALPSIVDLFAACPGRPAPDGLTPADTAYLRALYTAHEPKTGDHSAVLGDVAAAMAPLLANPRLASR